MPDLLSLGKSVFISLASQSQMKKKLEDYNRPYCSAIPGLQFRTIMLEVPGTVWANGNLSNLVFFQFAVCLSWFEVNELEQRTVSKNTLKIRTDGLKPLFPFCFD